MLQVVLKQQLSQVRLTGCEVVIKEMALIKVKFSGQWEMMRAGQYLAKIQIKVYI